MAKFRYRRVLRPSNWVELPVGYWWLLRARWRMRRLDIPDLLDVNKKSEGNHVPQGKPEEGLVRRRAGIVNFAARHPVGWAKCLNRSLALRDWLARDGICTTLRLAVRMHEGNFQAHAWLEREEKVVNDNLSATSQFEPFDLEMNISERSLNDSKWNWNE